MLEGVRHAGIGDARMQRFLFNRSVHKSVNKRAICAICAMSAELCTPCTLLDAALRRCKKSMRVGGPPWQLNESSAVIRVDGNVVLGEIAGPEAAFSVPDSKVNLYGELWLAQVPMRCPFVEAGAAATTFADEQIAQSN
jgi:hypothetical protein